MKLRNTGAVILLAVFVIAGFAGIWRLQALIDAQQSAIYQEQDDLVLRSSKLMKVMSLEYAPLLADIYWTRAVQYFGNKHANEDINLQLLWPLLDIATTLDPNLMVAYRFGSTFLSDAAPRGAGRPDLAVQLIERGIQANPKEWRLYQDLGNIYYFDMKDYAKASQAFLDGSKNPTAQIWMKVMAAKIAAEGDSFETSMFLWKNIYDTTVDPAIKENASTHLQILRAQEDCRQIDALSEGYQKRFSRRPVRVGELVESGFLHGVPGDPRGYPYVLSAGGKAGLNPASPLAKKQFSPKLQP